MPNKFTGFGGDFKSWHKSKVNLYVRAGQLHGGLGLLIERRGMCANDETRRLEAP